MRIGIVGTENSHTDYYLRCFNVEGRYPGHRVVALAGGASARNVELARVGGASGDAGADAGTGVRTGGDAGAGAGLHIVEEARDLIGRVDAAIVCSRDGRRHRAEATMLLEAGLPVFVDKPLACSLADAEAILAAARKASVPVSSYSSLRWVPLVTELAERIARTGAPQRVAVVGPADAESPYAGIWFYGIHVVEIALALLPGCAVTGIDVQTAPGKVLVSAQAGPTRLALTLVRPGPEGLPPWEITVDGAAGTERRELTLDADYGAPGVAELVRMLESGRGPLSEAELLAPVEVLAEIAAALPEPS